METIDLDRISTLRVPTDYFEEAKKIDFSRRLNVIYGSPVAAGGYLGSLFLAAEPQEGLKKKKLRALPRLVSLGKITARRANGEAMESARRSLAKAVTWRIIAVLITTAVAWGWTSEISFALKIGLCDMMAKIVLYYMHERAWNNVDYGRETASDGEA